MLIRFTHTFHLILPLSILDGRIEDLALLIGVPDAWASVVEAFSVLALITILVYLIGRLLVLPGFDLLLDTKGVDRHIQLTLLKGLHIIVIATAIGLGFYISGYTFLLGAIIAGLAAGGLSIGIALQGAVRNLVAGLFIHAEKPFRIGDEIEWDDNAGVVEDIRLRVTRVRSFDNKFVTVPNSKLTDGITKNPVRDGPLRLEVDFPIDLKADVDQAKEIILAEANAHEKVLDDPPPAAFLMEFEESRLRLQGWIWLANRDIGSRVPIRDEFATGVKRALEEAGIEIPYPHRRLSHGPDSQTRSGVASNASQEEHTSQSNDGVSSKNSSESNHDTEGENRLDLAEDQDTDVSERAQSRADSTH